MKIALVYPPFKHKLFNENLFFVDEHFGIFPSLGLLYAAAVARNWGAEVRIWDSIADRLSRDEVLKKVKEFSPDLLGFTIHAVTTFWDTMEWLSYFKKELSLPILVGGHEVEPYAKEIMTHDVIDYAILGDAPRVLPEFLDAFSGRKKYSGIPGITFRKNHETIINPRNPDQTPFEKYPFPARDLLNTPDRYFSHVSQKHRFTIMLSSIGCPYGCTFCAISRTGFDARSPRNVVDEMEECVKKHNVKEIDFFDPLMLYDRNRTIELAEEIKNRKMDVIWSCRSRVDVVDEEMLDALAESGCVRIFYGIESADPDVLAKMSKGIDIYQVHKIINKSAEVGIRPLGFFQIGGPGDTRESVEKTIKLALSLPLDYAQFLRTVAKPHSKLEQDMNRELGYEYWKEFVKGNAKEIRTPAPWTEMSEREIFQLTKKAYMAFYGRPKYVLKMLFRSKSLGEIWRYFLVWLEMVLTRTPLKEVNQTNPDG
ncbi:MAG: B12-binding domain-containing radical SAM protein [Candidatus Eremiobacteraeota bacterium]|nr:B12-binding domain-containing radical SAM protein [Candidatus Eremiobacteraeota bacterium]